METNHHDLYFNGLLALSSVFLFNFVICFQAVSQAEFALLIVFQIVVSFV